MELSNDIVLRPRFTLELPIPPERILRAFEDVKEHTTAFVLSRIDDHVFIRIPKKEQHFWSPQLHLEIYKIDDQPTTVKGLYGPNPTVWTMFMFLHFVVATSFIGAGIWLYTTITLDAPYMVPLLVMVGLFISWFILYAAGSIGKATGKKEMYALRDFLQAVLATIGSE